MLAAVAAVAWVASLAGAFVGVRLSGSNDRHVPRTPSTLGFEVAEPNGSALVSPILEAAWRIGPSVVSIHVVAERDGASGQAAGTGVVLTTDGEIVTNAHVVDGASAVWARLPGDSEPVPAAVLAVDAMNDLALLRVDVEGLHPATFAAPGDVRVGDPVVAVGYALDIEGDPSVTAGVVSALDRTSSDPVRLLSGLIQTDTPISSGNSGGPLVNLDGEVVGITTFVATGRGDESANSLGFAIGTAKVLDTLEALRESAAGGATRPMGYLGVTLDRRDDGGSGAVVTDVEDGSPAATAGVQAGDIVVELDGDPVSGEAALASAIRAHDPGDTVVLTIVRDGTRTTVEATLGVRPPD
jgi:S1-C subfamily serine protease